MHEEVHSFMKRMKNKFPYYFSGGRVLEIGSYDINGSVRGYFQSAQQYVGVDLIRGKGVDCVSLGHEYTSPIQFDVTISTEAFEHDPYWAATFRNMVHHTRMGGLVLITCASTGRNPHGTREHNPDDSPGTLHHNWNYYQNLTDDDFINRFPLPNWFHEHEFEYEGNHKDLYFWGLRK